MLSAQHQVSPFQEIRGNRRKFCNRCSYLHCQLSLWLLPDGLHRHRKVQQTERILSLKKIASYCSSPAIRYLLYPLQCDRWEAIFPPIPSADEGIICGRTIAPATTAADRLTKSLLDDLFAIFELFWLD